MDHAYWRQRWAQGRTGWHQPEVEPALVRHFGGRARCRVLVPLCGKSRDLAWLRAQGHEVLGVELSEVACENFFREQGLEARVAPRGRFIAYSVPGLTILNGDVFDLDLGTAGALDAAYDRAALIALPPEARIPYSALIRRLSPPEILQIALTRPPGDTGGPPFSVTETELRALYAADYDVALLAREAVELGGAAGAAPAEESAYRMTRLRVPT